MSMTNPAGVGTGYVPIKPDTDGFGRELEQGLEREGTPAAGRAGSAVAKAMKATFFAGVAAIGKSVFDFGGFEKGMNEVFTLLPGISGAAMDEMSEQVKAFATEFRVLPTDVVPALYQSLSAGVPRDNVFEFLGRAQKLAKGGVTDLAVAVDGLSSVVNAYGADVIDAGKASDVMFTTVKLGKTTIAELSASLFQVIPTAAGVGTSFEDVSAALATLTLQGVPTSVATTQLRQLLVELSKAGSQTATVFEDVAGKTFPEFMASGGTLGEALDLLQGHADATGKSIADLFGSVEAAAAARSLAGPGADAYSAAFEQMQDSAGATDAAFKQMNRGLAATLDGIRARLAVTMLNIGEAIAPTIGVLGEGLNLALELFGKLPGPMQAVAVLLGTITAGLFAFAKPIQNGIALFKQLGGVWKALAANPWVLVLAGLVLVTVAIVKNWSKVKAALSATWGWMRQAGQSIASFFVTLWRGVGVAASAAWGTVTSAARGSVTAVTTVLHALGATVSAIFDGITVTISTAWNTVASVTTATWGIVWGVVSTVGGSVVSFLTGIPNAVASAFSTLADVISAPFRRAFELVKVAWNSTVGGFGFSVPDWIPFVGGKDFRIPSMASGGVLTAPQLVLAGEYPGAKRDPEIVTPQSIMRETVREALATTAPAGPLFVIEMNVTSEVRDPSFFERQATEIARVVAAELERSRRGAGQLLTRRTAA